MSLTFWNRRRREAAEAGEERDPQEVLDTLTETAGEPGTEGVEGHTGTDHTEPPLGAPEVEGSEVDASGETHEDAAAETEPAESAEEAAEVAPAIAAVEAEDEKPQGNASKADWTDYALAHGRTEEDLAGLNRDGIRDLFA